MSDQQNGQDPPQMQPQQLPMQRVVEEAIRIVVQTMVAGVLTNTRNVPPSIVLPLLAWHTGNHIGNLLEADLPALLAARKGLKDAFADGIQKAAVRPPAQPQPPPMTKLS